MDITQFYPETNIREVEKYGNIRFTPINVEFFIRLMDWHQKSFGDIQRSLAALADSQDTETVLLYQEAIACLVHTATYPFKKDEVDFQVWKDTVSKIILTRPAFVEWFMNYFQGYMPEGAKQGK